MEIVVIGGGIAGLATAYRQRQLSAGSDRSPRVRVIESAARFGGKILTERSDGFVLEGGPDSLIPQKPRALELVRELGLADHLVGSNDAHRRTFVVKDGRMVPLPDGLQLLLPGLWRPFLGSPLLSWPAKLRVALERFVPPRRDGADESVADFVRRRLGRGVLAPLAEPLLGHIHVADVERMSLAATYPRLAQLEQRFGSLHRGLQAMRQGAGDGPLFWTLRDGIGELVQALVKQLEPESLLLGHRALGVRRAAADGGYLVRLDDGRDLPADAVVLAAPAYAAGELTAELDPRLPPLFRAIPYVSTATLSLGYRRADVGHPLDGFGFFVPRREGRSLLGCTWTSSKFDHRSPRDGALLRLFLGGAGHEDLLELGDDELVATLARDLEEIMGLRAVPRLVRLYRWPRGYPQYELGHLERVRRIEEALPRGLLLAGNAYRGVGLPDCIAGADRAAEGALAHLRKQAPRLTAATSPC